MRSINIDNQLSRFQSVIKCTEAKEAVSQTNNFIAAYNPANKGAQSQLAQVCTHLKNKVKPKSKEEQKEINDEIKKVKNISRSLVFYKKIEKEYGEDLAKTYVGSRCDGKVISNAEKNRIEKRCKEGIVIRTYEIPPEQLPNQPRKKLVQQYNDSILEKLKASYGFDEVKLAMQRCYPARDRKEMGQGERAIKENTLKLEIENNQKARSEVKAKIEKSLKNEKKIDRLSGDALSSTLDLAMKNDKVQANYVKHGINSQITCLSIITCFKTYEKNLQKHVDGMNQVLHSSPKVTAQDVLEAAQAVGGDTLVMKLLNNKRMDKSEQQTLFQKTQELSSNRDQQKVSMDRHLMGVKAFMQSSDVSVEQIIATAKALKIDLNKPKLSEDECIDIADKLRGLD